MNSTSASIPTAAPWLAHLRREAERFAELVRQSPRPRPAHHARALISTDAQTPLRATHLVRRLPDLGSPAEGDLTCLSRGWPGRPQRP